MARNRLHDPVAGPAVEREAGALRAVAPVQAAIPYDAADPRWQPIPLTDAEWHAFHTGADFDTDDCAICHAITVPSVGDDAGMGRL